MNLRRLVPDSLFGWTVLVLAAGLALSHLIGLGIYSGNRLDTLIGVGGRLAAERIAAAVEAIEAAPPEERPALARRLGGAGFRAVWSREPLVPEGAESAPMLIRSVKSRLGEERLVRATIGPPEPMARGPGMWPGPGTGPGSGFGPGSGTGMHRWMHGGPSGEVARVAVGLRDGTWLNVVAPFDPGEPLWRPRFLLSFLVMAGIALLLSVWAVRRGTKPLENFALAAERLGLDVNAPPLAEQGPREVRAAAQAFNRMQDRLKRFVADRTQMLAAISHDLRTPITRLKLRAEFVEDEEQKAKMLADLDEMERMIAATLAFARDDAAREPSVPVDLARLLAELAEGFAAGGAAISYEGPAALVLSSRPGALKRAVGNLIGNALKYGKRARLLLREEPGRVEILVEDEGPGIPESDMERVFQPFFRLDPSRSRDTGGTGLGLSVARSVARAHGGEVLLENRAEGGLRARLILPRAA